MKVKWLIILILAATNLHAQCIQGDCINGLGTFTFEDGSKYHGNFSNGIIEGRGILYFADGNKYLGQWKENKRSGQGRLIFTSGDVYTGYFEDDAFSGYGELAYANGNLFRGDWSANKPNGRGILSYANGSHKAGLYKDGVCIHAEDIRIEDANILISKKDIRDCTHCKCHDEIGSFTYSDGSIYIGDFNDGKPEGEGKCDYASGDKYVGGWKNHAPHGEGIMYFRDGKVYGAEWHHGTPVKLLNPIEDYQALEVASEKNDEIKIWAVIVGVSRYEHMPVLKYSDDDAYKIYAFLKSPEGGAVPDNQISILIDEDASREKIIAKLQETLLKADENDVALVYFSGHGLEGSFLPIDFDGYNNRLSYNDFLDVMNRSEARHKICFADACHSGSMQNYKGVEEAISKYYKELNTTEAGTAFMLSSKGEEIFS